MNRSLWLSLLALSLLFVLPGCMTLYEVVPGPFPNSSYVLAGRAPFPMGRVSFCDDDGCGEVFTFEDVDGHRIRSIGSDAGLSGVWVLAGSPLIYQGRLYYCAGGGCRFRENFATFESVERVRVELDDETADEIDEQRDERRRRADEQRDEEWEKRKRDRGDCKKLREGLEEQLRRAGVVGDSARRMLEEALARQDCLEDSP